MKIFLATTSKLKSDILNTVGINHFLVENTYEENSKEKDIYKIRGIQCRGFLFISHLLF